MKQEYKTLKQKLLNIAGKEETKGETELNDNQNLCYIETKDRKNEDCLVLIKNIEKEIVKEDILVAVRHCCNPAYIDYKKGADSCVIRFENKTLRNAFFEKCFLRNLKIGKNLVIDYNDLFKKSLKFL